MSMTMIDYQEAQALLADAEVIYSEAQVSAAVASVAEAISADLKEKCPLLLCVMTGGLVFAGQLMTQLSFPLQVDYLHVTRYGQETAGGALAWKVAPWTSVKDRVVLVIDDILDEGVTLAAICDRLLQLGAAEVKTAVFADKRNGLDKPVAADYAAVSVPNRFIFGYGMDVRGAWRNLPAVYAVKGL